ncbi:hypothetical protein D3C72_1703360 [compost metagenome]
MLGAAGVGRKHLHHVHARAARRQHFGGREGAQQAQGVGGVRQVDDVGGQGGRHQEVGAGHQRVARLAFVQHRAHAQQQAGAVLVAQRAHQVGHAGNRPGQFQGGAAGRHGHFGGIGSGGGVRIAQHGHDPGRQQGGKLGCEGSGCGHGIPLGLTVRRRRLTPARRQVWPRRHRAAAARDRYRRIADQADAGTAAC